MVGFCPQVADMGICIQPVSGSHHHGLCVLTAPGCALRAWSAAGRFATGVSSLTARICRYQAAVMGAAVLPRETCREGFAPVQILSRHPCLLYNLARGPTLFSDSLGRRGSERFRHVSRLRPGRRTAQRSRLGWTRVRFPPLPLHESDPRRAWPGACWPPMLSSVTPPSAAGATGWGQTA